MLKDCPKCKGLGFYQFQGDDPMLLTLCEICKQTGKYEEYDYSICDKCHGLGEIVVVKKRGLIKQQQLVKCKECNGKGLIEKPKRIGADLNILW